MKWYENAVFYHIYPLGLCGCAHQNAGAEVSKFEKLKKWSKHACDINCTAIYIGPLFESQGHGYETTDYRTVDRRLGTNEEFRDYVDYCHSIGLKVIVDGVFNHVGRDFFAFADLKENRENSQYKDWFCNVNFGGNNEYNDGFCYDNWGGYNLLVKLNHYNMNVREYLLQSVKMWIEEFDIDGIRLDAADVLDHGFMEALRAFTEPLKADFWLMGEVIHGNYSMWASDKKLHSVTNYELHKALYSGHNDHNYFEIAHNVKRMIDNCQGLKLYSFVDNHDVSRIASKLNNKAHLQPVSVLEYALPGIPSIYYGSEFAITGEKQNGDDWNLRPDLILEDFSDNQFAQFLTLLGKAKKELPELTLGDYRELLLKNRQYAFSRTLENSAVIVAVNNDDAPSTLNIRLPINATKAYDVLENYKNAKPQTEEPQESLDFAPFAEVASKAQEICDTLKAVDDERSAEKVDEMIKSLQSQYDNAMKLVFGKSVEQSFAESSQCEIIGGNLVVTLPANSGTLIKVCV